MEDFKKRKLFLKDLSTIQFAVVIADYGISCRLDSKERA